ncbi:MAG: DNA gyrase C-terminal beta-propeller domain-containing protein [Saprospiraceae bacterium]|nr:DNA gyrase C-terminal beta-propeller domain-containing protein [Saprospiraceae bacterium]
MNILTTSRSGIAKRTHRHLYNRQHRGGMGIFDLDSDDNDPPVCLAGVDDSQNLLLFTNKARVFRYNLNRVPDNPIRSKGEALFDRIPLEADESLMGILSERSSGSVALIGANGRVRVLRHHLFGEHLKPGTAMYPYNDFGPLASVCWTNGDGELLVVSRYGVGIRFNEKLIPPTGDLAIKLSGDDRVVAITPVYADSEVFVIGADGKGTLRSMSGFAPNKSMGGSGKQLFKSNKVVGMVTVSSNDDLFIISQLSKIIRFRADEVPVSEGVVQGVICMSLRADEVTAVTTSPLQVSKY